MSIIDRQITVYGADQIDLQFFLRRDVDTVKAVRGESKSYFHLSDGDVENYKSKNVLRKALSQESGGAWAEEKEGSRRYFIEKRGWLSTSHKEVSQEECLKEIEKLSALQKIQGIGLGILAMLPGAVEVAKNIPLGAKEAGLGLLTLQMKSSASSVLGTLFFASQIDAQTPEGSEFQINSYTTLDQYDSEVAQYSGGFVVVWVSNEQDGDLTGIYGQKYDVNGTPLGSEFRVNTYTTNFQSNAALSSLIDGGFVVGWASNEQDGDGYGVYAQKYDLTGAVDGTEFHVSTYTVSTQRYPEISSQSNGGFVIVWGSFGQDTDFFGVFGQRYTATGAAAGPEFQANTYITNHQNNPDVTSLSNGGFVVVWSSTGQDGSSSGIYGQRYDSNGGDIDGEFQVNTVTMNAQNNVKATKLIDGRFVIVWASSGQDGSGYGVFGQMYNATGGMQGTEFQVNTYVLSDQNGIAIAPLNNGGFVVVWRSEGQDGDLGGIYGQMFGDVGTPKGPEFRVNSNSRGDQLDPSVALLDGERFVVTWTSEDQDGSGAGVFGQIFNTTEIVETMPVLLTSPSTSTPMSSLSTSILQMISSVRSSWTTISSPVATSTQPQSSSSMSSTSFSMGTTYSTEDSSVSSRAFSATPTPSIASSSSSQTTSSASEISTSSSTNGFPNAVNIEYDVNYDIVVNGQIVGTYSFSGGSGLLDPNNANTLVINLDSDFYPEDGDMITLFSFAADQAGQWDNLIVEGENTECLAARGAETQETTSGSYDYQLIFEVSDSCIVAAVRFSANFIPFITQ